MDLPQLSRARQTVLGSRQWPDSAQEIVARPHLLDDL